MQRELADFERQVLLTTQIRTSYCLPCITLIFWLRFAGYIPNTLEIEWRNPSRTLSPCFRALGPPPPWIFKSVPFIPISADLRAVGPCPRPSAVRSFMHVPSIFPSAAVSAAHLLSPSLFSLSLRCLSVPSTTSSPSSSSFVGPLVKSARTHRPKLRCVVHGPVPSTVGQLFS